MITVAKEKASKAEEKVSAKLIGTPNQLQGEHSIFLSNGETVVFRDGRATVSSSLLELLEPYIEKEE